MDELKPKPLISFALGPIIPDNTLGSGLKVVPMVAVQYALTYEGSFSPLQLVDKILALTGRGTAASTGQ